VSAAGPCAALVAALARALAALPRPFAAAAALAWMAAIYWLSSGPRDLLPSGWAFQTLSNAAHAPIYGLLALLAARAAGAGWVGLAIALAYGVTDEWHQSLVPGRSASLADWLTDAIGAAGALWLLAAPRVESIARRRLVSVVTAITLAAAIATLADALR
jgi:VanZ family protein